MAGSLRDVLSNIRGKEEEVHDIEEDMSSKLSGDVSQQDLQAAAEEGEKASDLISQITQSLNQLLQRDGEAELEKVQNSVTDVEGEIKHEIQDPGGYQQEVEDVRRTLSEVEQVMDVIDLTVQTIEEAENAVTDLEKEELELLSEVQSMATKVEASGAEANVRNAAQYILKTDKAAVNKTVQLFRVGREVAEALEDTIEELKSALTELERKLNNIQTKVSAEERKEELKGLISEIDDLRERLSQQEQEIENVDWDELENETLSLEERMEKKGSWEALTGGMTNEIKARGDDVIKQFERSKTQLFTALGRVPSGQAEVPRVESRIENEKKFRKIYSELADDLPVHLPDIKEEEGNRILVERVQGKPLNKFLNSSSSASKQRELGRKVGEFVRFVHDHGISITDFRINNLIVRPDGDLALVDVEYANIKGASGYEKSFMDLITMVSSARQVDPEAYRNFMDGFKQQYGEVGVLQKAIAAVTSKAHAAGLEKDRNRTTNAVKNTANSLKFWG